MPLILGTNSIKDTGFNVANSLRFNDGSSDNLSRNTWGTPTSDKKFTISVWVKRCTNGATQQIVNSFAGSGNDNQLKFKNTDAIELTVSTASTEHFLKTNRLFRDNSAWYHIVFAFDSTQGTDSNRYKLYVNGTEETSFSSVSYPPQDTTYQFFNNSNRNRIGIAHGGSAEPFDGYMAEFVFIDGQQLDPTSFGEFDEDSPNIWKPIDVSGLTFGTNGFYLDFENSGSLGADVSGNSKNFTVNNLTSIDQSTDTCTNNFCTLNPLTKSSATFSEGNLKQGGAGASAVATFGVSSGKWYFEQKILGGNNEAHLGFALENSGIFKDNVTGSTVRGSGYVSLYSFDGKIYNEGSATSSFGTFSANDIVSFALDVDAGDVFIYQNGTVLNSGSAVVSGKTGKTWFPFGNFDAGNVTGIEHNFGGTQTFTISSGNSDEDGHGNFEFAVPSGHFALCTKNLAEYG